MSLTTGRPGWRASPWPDNFDALDTVLNRALLYRDRRDFVIRAGDTG